MGENQKKILQMLAEGKITVDEASRLLSAIGPVKTLANRQLQMGQESQSLNISTSASSPRRDIPTWSTGDKGTDFTGTPARSMSILCRSCVQE